MDFDFIPPGEDDTETRAPPDLSQFVRNEEGDEEADSPDHVSVMEDSQDLLTTVMAEFSGTLRQETRDPDQVNEEVDEPRKLDNNVDPCILDRTHHESPPENTSTVSNKICDLQQPKLSDTFCDEIFL